MSKSPTIGEYRVGITFNPDGNPAVDKIKRAAADFIDMIETIRLENTDQPEIMRLAALAQTHAEDAAMWGVKAVTKPARE